LTGNYLQIDAGRLEEECRLARERGKTVCVWTGNGIGDFATCGPEWSLNNVFGPGILFAFCPFCGKQIKVKT
jgi:hypothetical protein